ncbi:MAG: 30S ribosomal protein S6 [Planctomycetota bacterium]
MYEGMFLLDNQVVREDWKKAKAIITDTLKKHGANVVSARRFDERRLAYPIRRRRRATFCLAFYEMSGEHLNPLRRDLELNENVLRYLILAKESVPATELELAAAEDAADFNVPTPPPDDAPDAPVIRRREGGELGADETGEPRMDRDEVDFGDVSGKDE